MAETTENKGEKGSLQGEKTDAQVREEILRTYQTVAENYSGRYKSVEGDTYSMDGSSFKGGFYYDCQLEDPFLSMSLHANTKIIDGKWEKWPEEEGRLDPIDEENGSEWAKCYGRFPIARCILSEDFSYSIANNFSDYNAGNSIESLFESFKPYAPILAKIGEGTGKGIDEVEKDNNFGSSLVKGISGLMKNLGVSNLLQNSSNYLNKALFVQGSRFSYYNGTQFNFNNMEMKFIAFSDYVTTDGVTWSFQSVEDYIKTIQPYVMGIYTPYSADFLKDTGVQGEAKKFIQEYVGFQEPPGGFKMDTRALNNTLEGTLRLNIGGTWAIDNLVIKGMNVSMSRVQAKHPENEGETVPLYAEISLQLAPAASIVDTGYRKILDHSGLSDIRGTLHGSYRDRLNELKSNYK